MTDQAEHNYDRRRSDQMPPESRVRIEIMEQLAEIESPEYRVVLTLMLRMQDETNVYFSTLQAHLIQIHGELSKIQRSEEQVKQLVLNGYAEKHPEHHAWIDQKMKQDAACGLVLNRHGEDGLCEHARQMIEEREVAKRRKWKVQDGIAEKAGLILFAVFAAALFPHLAAYFK